MFLAWIIILPPLFKILLKILIPTPTHKTNQIKENTSPKKKNISFNLNGVKKKVNFKKNKKNFKKVKTKFKKNPKLSPSILNNLNLDSSTQTPGNIQ